MCFLKFLELNCSELNIVITERLLMYFLIAELLESLVIYFQGSVIVVALTLTT